MCVVIMVVAIMGLPHLCMPHVVLWSLEVRHLKVFLLSEWISIIPECFWSQGSQYEEARWLELRR